jgi:hypothetical protein
MSFLPQDHALRQGYCNSYEYKKSSCAISEDSLHFFRTASLSISKSQLRFHTVRFETQRRKTDVQVQVYQIAKLG